MTTSGAPNKSERSLDCSDGSSAKSDGPYYSLAIV